jgi:dTMP kinase
MSTGKFITLEGGEGGGKSTQTRLLASWLEARGHMTLVTREPGGTPLAEKIRALLLNPENGYPDPLTEALLFNAARRDHLMRVIRPALAAGTHVICDRFADSTRAYQGAGGRLDAAVIAQLEQLVVTGTMPDLTLVLDLPADAGLARVAARHQASGAEKDRFEIEDMAFHQRLREAFFVIAAREPGRCALIDAQPAPEVVAAAIAEVAAARLGL